MALEDGGDLVEGHLSDGHLLGAQVPGSLGGLGLAVGLIGLDEGPDVCQNWAQLAPQGVQRLLHRLQRGTLHSHMF